MWIEALEERRNPSRERFEIRDTQGEVLLVLPFSEIAEIAPDSRRPPWSFGALQKNIDRAIGLQREVRSQIDVARMRLSETKESLDRLEAIMGAQSGR